MSVRMLVCMKFFVLHFQSKILPAKSQLEYFKYELERPKYDEDECRQRGLTFAAPLKVTLRLIVLGNR